MNDPTVLEAITPFVSRALRRGRLRLAVCGAAIGGALVVLFGIWIALSSNSFSRDVRVAMDLEQPLWQREHAEHVHIALDDDDYRAALELRRRLLAEPTEASADAFHPIAYLHDEGRKFAAYMIEAEPPREHRELYTRSVALLHGDLPSEVHRVIDDLRWHSAHDVKRLRSFVDNGGVPRVERYRPPLSSSEAMRVVGFFASLALTLLVLIIAPVLAGLAVAQERHENTLAPILGTGMSTRQVAWGITAGAIAWTIVAVLPLALIVLVTAVLTGSFVTAAGFLVATGSSAMLLIPLALLAGHGLGKRHAPGIVALGLAVTIGLLGTIGLVGGVSATGHNLLRQWLPHAVPAHLLEITFLPTQVTTDAAALSPVEHVLRIVIAIAIVAALARIAWSAFEQRLAPTTSGTTLSRRAAWGAAATIAIAAAMGVDGAPFRGFDDVGVQFAKASLPLTLVVMARVDLSKRRLLGRELLGRVREGAAYAMLALTLVATFAIARLLFDGPSATGITLGLVSVAWAVGTGILLSIRWVLRPVRLAEGFAIGVVGLVVLGQYGLGMFSSPAARSLGEALSATFPTFEASPIFGLLHVAALVAGPWFLVRSIRDKRRG